MVQGHKSLYHRKRGFDEEAYAKEQCSPSGYIPLFRSLDEKQNLIKSTSESTVWLIFLCFEKSRIYDEEAEYMVCCNYIQINENGGV